MRSVLLIPTLAVLVCCAVAQLPPDGSETYATVADWTAETNHTLYMKVVEAAAPELAAAFEDPAFTGTVFALSDRVWEFMAVMDEQGTFDNMLAQIESNATYAAGFKKIVQYNVVPDTALTYADLEEQAAQGKSLPTLLEGQQIGTRLEGGRVTLIPLGMEIGTVQVIPVPDVVAGNATVITVDKVLLPKLF